MECARVNRACLFMSGIEVKTLKSFKADDGYVKKNSTITVDEFRAKELLRNGLIEDYEVKSAPVPENKKAPDPDNKVAGKPKPGAQAKAK